MALLAMVKNYLIAKHVVVLMVSSTVLERSVILIVSLEEVSAYPMAGQVQIQVINTATQTACAQVVLWNARPMVHVLINHVL